MVWWRQRNMAQGRDDQLFIQEYLPRFSAAGYYWPYLPPNNQNQLMVKWKQDKAKPRLVRDDFSRGHPHPGRDQGPEQRSGVVCGSGLWTPDLQNGERLFPCAHLPHLNPNPGPRPPCYPHEEWAWMQTEPHRQTQMDARTRGSITNRYMPTAERAVWRWARGRVRRGRGWGRGSEDVGETKEGKEGLWRLRAGYAPLDAGWI